MSSVTDSTNNDSVLNAAGNPSKRNTIWIISLAVIFVLAFCGGFVYFYLSRQAKHSSQVQNGTGKPLPFAQLIDESNQILPDSELRHGRLILVFVTIDCDACLKESDFLRTVVTKQNNIPFYAVISFGDKETSLRDGKDKFPFKLLYDQNHQLAAQLGIVRVPIKLFVEDGVIKKSWGGATIDDQAKASFTQWLEEQR